MADNNFGGASSNNATANSQGKRKWPKKTPEEQREANRAQHITQRANRKVKRQIIKAAKQKEQIPQRADRKIKRQEEKQAKRLNEKKLNESWEKLAEETKEMQQRIEAIAARVDRVENNGTNAGDSSMEVTREIYRIEEPPFLTATIESTSETVDKLPVLTASIEKEDAVHRGEVTMNGSIQAQVETGDVGRDMAVA